ncbi:MAG: RnfABCDGE type electron transport complex subunit G [Clostridia bacterium]|nr:RnfABCDGE type electron transport complex subunit G [Clostridia bacterium]
MDKNMVKMIVCLVAIAIVTAALLAVVNGLTAPVIEKNNQQQLEDSLREVLSADQFDIVSDENGVTIYAAKKGGNLVGHCVVNSEKGYGGDVKVMTGVLLDGSVNKVAILEHGETPGLGANAEKADFINQFIGKIKGVKVNKNSPAGNEIKAISGATITSTAVTNAVNAAIEFAEEAAK